MRESIFEKCRRFYQGRDAEQWDGQIERKPDGSKERN